MGQFLGRRRQWPRVPVEGRSRASRAPVLARRRQDHAPGLASGPAGRCEAPWRRPDRLHAAHRSAVVYRQPVVRRAGTEPGRLRHFPGRPAGAGGAGAALECERQGARVATAAGARLAAFDAAAATVAAALAQGRAGATGLAARQRPAGRWQRAALERFRRAVLRLRWRARRVRSVAARGAASGRGDGNYPEKYAR